MTDDETYSQHSAVPTIERILAAAAARSPHPVPVRGGKVVADRGLWLCACVSFDDAPTWLIYETDDGAFGWRRVPAGQTETALLDATVLRGDHVDPDGVLAWLENRDVRHWPGERDQELFATLGRTIRELAGDDPHEPR